MKLHVETTGQGEDLVLLHGWGFHAGVWQALLPSLAHKFRITLIDLPGFGRSPAPKRAYQLVDVVPAILAHTPVQATFIGWSLGGLIAIAIAADAPQRVTRLLTVGTTPKFIAAAPWPGIAKEVFAEFRQGLQHNTAQVLRRFLLLQQRCFNQQRALYKQLNAILGAYHTPSITALLSGLQILQASDLRTQLRQINAPQLHVIGDDDPLIPASTAENIKTLVPHATSVLLTGAGHIPFLSHQEIFLQHMLDFIYDTD